MERSSTLISFSELSFLPSLLFFLSPFLQFVLIFSLFSLHPPTLNLSHSLSLFTFFFTLSPSLTFFLSNLTLILPFLPSFFPPFFLHSSLPPSSFLLSYDIIIFFFHYLCISRIFGRKLRRQTMDKNSHSNQFACLSLSLYFALCL